MPGEVSALESSSTKGNISSDAVMSMKKGGAFSFSAGSNGMAFKANGKDGVSFAGAEESAGSSLSSKAADITSAGNSLSSVGEKAAQHAAKKSMTFITEGATKAAYATADKRQGLSLNAEKGVSMKNSATQSSTAREIEATTKKEGAKETSVKKSTESQLQSQADNTMATTGKSDLTMLTNGKQNKLKVDAADSTTGTTSLVANSAQSGILEGVMKDGNTQKKTSSTYDNTDRISGQAQFKVKGAGKLETELDTLKGLNMSGEAQGETSFAQNVDMKNNHSSKSSDDSKTL
jgi:hypothetical protein